MIRSHGNEVEIHDGADSETLESTIMKVQFSEDIRIFVACGQTDMRKSIDGLSAIVGQTYKLDPFQNALFLFCGNRRDRVKALYWEGDGFLLLYKRLENGSFQWPRAS